MAVTKNDQYCPPSTLETAADDGLSVRTIRELAAAMNNYMAWAGRHKLRGQPFMPHLESPASGTTETLVQPFAPVVIPDGVNTLQFHAGHYLGTGTSVTWKLYLMEWMYWLDEAFDSAALSPSYSTALWSSTSGTHDIEDGTIAVVKGVHDYVWPFITAENAASSRAYITTLDIYPAAA